MLRSLSVLLLLFVLSGCNTLRAAVGNEAAGADSPQPDLLFTEPAPPTDEARERMDNIYRILLAELAGQRGDMSVAVSNYVEVARHTGDPKIAERALRVALFARDDDAALESARIWVGAVPGSLEARRTLTALYIRKGDVDAAVRELNELFAVLNATPDQVYALMVEFLGRERDRTGALQVMERFLEGRASDPKAALALAHLAVRAGNTRRAADLLTTLVQEKPRDPAAVTLYAQVLQADGKTGEALDLLRRAVADEPRVSALRLTFARLLVSAKRFDEALDEFRQLARQEPENGDVAYALALLLLQTNRLDEAQARLLALAQSDRHRMTAHYYLGQLAETRGDGGEALRWYEQVEEGEHFLDAQIRTAVLLSRDGRLDDARGRLQGARVESDRDRIRLWQVEAELLLEADRREEAMGVLDAALEEYPEDTELLYGRAMLAEKMDRLDVLERDLLDILSREPDNAQALNALGYTLADRTTRYQEAYEYIARALKERPEDYYILDSMGWVLYRLGRHEEALEYLRRAAALSDDLEVAAHLGEVLWVLGAKDEARAVWEGALQATPDDARILEVIRRLTE